MYNIAFNSYRNTFNSSWTLMLVSNWGAPNLSAKTSSTRSDVYLIIQKIDHSLRKQLIVDNHPLVIETTNENVSSNIT